MREIKFRAWHKIAEKMTEVNSFTNMHYKDEDEYKYVVTSEEAGYDKPHKAPFLIALEKMQPKGNCIWMIGDNPINDIRGSKESINAITFQKIHEGVELGSEPNAPDVSFNDFRSLRELLTTLCRSK